MSALFLYGVLRADLADEAGAALLAGLGPGWTATTSGALWAVHSARGWSPALLPGTGTVQGMVHEAGDVDLAALDAYAGPAYRRTPLTVTSASGELPATGWLYVAPLPDHARPIPDGDFSAWLDGSGQPPATPIAH